MLPNRNKPTIIIICLLAIIISMFIWYELESGSSTLLHSDTAVWDLRGISFENSNTRLSGPVEYIPNALLTPEEFEAREDEAVIGYPQEAAQYATSRMRVILPSDDYYTFFCRSIDYSHRLYVNGVWMLDVGSPGETKESTVPNTGKITLTLQPENGVIEIIQQSSNFVHREGGGHSGWHIGGTGLLGVSQNENLREVIQLGSFLALFFVHAILFLLLRTYRANLYFALFCLTWFLRSGVIGSKTFTVLFPWIPWVVKFRIEYLAFPITAVLLVSLLNVLFPNILQKWFRYAVFGVSAVFAVLFLFADTVFMSRALLWCEAMYVPAILYIVVRFVMKLRSIRPDQGVFLIGIGLFFYAAVHDMFYYNNIVLFPAGDLSSVSMLLLTFCEAAAVFIATVHEMETAKAQEQRLAADNAALERLSRLRENMMAKVGHEMRTPLTVMSIYSQLVMETLRESGVDAQTASDLSMISGESKRLAELASEILVLTKEQEDKQAYDSVDIGAIITQVSRLCAPMFAKNRNRIELDVQENLPAVSGNAGECTQVLWNLLDNASRHTQGGVIKIGAALQEGQVAITVTDTGEGIADELLTHIFDWRVSWNDKSTGLGLSICKEIVESHGGQIGIISTQGEGTSVAFTLPVDAGDDNG